MGIFKRIKDIAKADIHDTLDKIEDPISMMKQYLRDLEEEIAKAESSLSNQLFIEKKYEALIAEANELKEKRIKQAELAVEKNEDEIAKLALQEKINQENKANAYEAQLESVKKQTEVLVDQINVLKAKYEELSQKKLVLISRATVAQTSVSASKAVVSINPDTALKGFARAEEKILELEAKASAYNAMQPVDFDNQKKLASLLDYQVAEELAQLKEAKQKQA